jgi:hypothetical protein
LPWLLLLASWTASLGLGLAADQAAAMPAVGVTFMKKLPVKGEPSWGTVFAG